MRKTLLLAPATGRRWNIRVERDGNALTQSSSDGIGGSDATLQTLLASLLGHFVNNLNEALRVPSCPGVSYSDEVA
ncbi:MAG: hypothetical protein AAGA03_01680 [Planctomycetota bacterium]